MKLTNRFGLPETIVRATERSNALYSKGPAHRSVTQLLQSPRIDALRRRHYAEVERDLSEEWWALFGSAVHYILELGAAANQIVEERLFTEVDGWTISGQLDCQTMLSDGRVRIEDYKVTSAYAVMQEKIEWEQQLNMQSFLLRRAKGRATETLRIIAIIRDWDRHRAASDAIYPQSPVISMQFPLWEPADQESFLAERINAHRQGELIDALGLELPECSAEDRWARGDEWAIKKAGGKRALMIVHSEEEALAKLSTDPKLVMEHRPGKSVRCEGNYCMAAPWCSQWKAMQGGQSVP